MIENGDENKQVKVEFEFLKSLEIGDICSESMWHHITTREKLGKQKSATYSH